MMIRMALVGVLLAGGVLLAADPPKPKDAKKAAKKLVEAIGEATVKGNYSVLFDHTYEPAFEAVGGREKAEEAAKEAVKQLKDMGFELKGFKSGDPGELYTEGDNTFVVIPTTLEMTSPDGTLLMKAYMLGISADDGKTWKFVNGSRMSEEMKKKVLPKLPAKLELPKPEPPELVKKK